MSRALKLKQMEMPEAKPSLRAVDTHASLSGVDAMSSVASTDAFSSRTPAHISPDEETYPGTRTFEVTGSHIAYTPRVRQNTQRRDGVRDVKLSGNPPNIWFNWNGHSWCAFEALGVPGASSVAVSQEAFRQAIAASQPDSHPFLNEAIQAIERCCK